jgi:DNA repair exonuclease SbcCD ATPase subunit
MAGSLEIKSVVDKLAALERRIKVLQALSTSKRLLDEIFLKLEALETRVAKVDMLSKKIDKTTAILDALCAKIRLA